MSKTFDRHFSIPNVNNQTIDTQNIPQGAIGVFDSGVGGLSIAKCIVEQLPNEHLIYVADTLHAPYGEKSVAFIIERVNIIADNLVNRGVKAIVIACNTATVNAVDQLRLRLKIPVIGVEPAIKPAMLQSPTKRVAVLVTQATADNLRFQKLIATHSKHADVIIQPCPGLVELIENSDLLYDGLTRSELLKQYLTPLLDKKIDTLVLGCTHYPFLTGQIMAITGDRVNIVETALAVTKQVIKRLGENNKASTANDNLDKAQVIMLSSKPTNEQQQLISLLWQSPVTLLPL